MSAGGILLNKENKIFLIRKISQNEWTLPKGTVEESEDILKAAIREVKEETGYADIRPREEKPFDETNYIMTHPKTEEKIDKTVYFFIFDLLSKKHAPTLQMETEKLEGEWFDIEGAINIAKFDGVKSVLKKAKNLL